MEKRVPKGRKMWTVQIDENGGVHIPKEALALIGLKAGESAVLMGDKRRGLVLVAESRVPSPGFIFIYSAFTYIPNARSSCAASLSPETAAPQRPARKFP